MKALGEANAGKSLSKIPGERGPLPDLVFFPITDADTCFSCGQCADNCPAGAIPEDDLAAQDNTLCISCSACAHVCPVEARTMGDARARELLHQAATVTFAGLHLETKLFL